MCDLETSRGGHGPGGAGAPKGGILILIVILEENAVEPVLRRTSPSVTHNLHFHTEVG